MDEKKLEEKIEKISRRIEDKTRNLGDMVDKKIREHLDSKEAKEKDSLSHRRNYEFWGIVFLVFGFIFLAENLHWIRWDMPLFPLAMIVIGFYLLFIR